MKTISVIRDRPLPKAYLVVWRTTTKITYTDTKKAQQHLTVGGQAEHDVDMVRMDETFKNISSHAIKRFLEYIGYSRDQTKVEITIGWEIVSSWDMD
jgi:hypothetical protein